MMNTGKILVVDDAEDIRFLVSTLLRSIGRETREARDGAQALEILEDDPEVRMVITDCHMPVMDGLELTRRIRRDERFEDLPVLMQTSSALDCLESRAAEAGVTKLLPKPINPETLRGEIDAILTDVRPNHVWRALLIGLPADAASMIRYTLSDAGFQVLQVPDEAQARHLLETIDGIDLAFVSQANPDCGPFIRAHLLRTEKDFYLFRLVLLMSVALSKDKFRGSFSSVAGYLTPPVSPEKVSALLRRLGLGSLPVRD
jgi:two-component system chemotaxis response regulator CheY